MKEKNNEIVKVNKRITEFDTINPADLDAYNGLDPKGKYNTLLKKGEYKNSEYLKKVKKNEFLINFPKLNYNITRTCKAVGISYDTFKIWQVDDEKFKNHLDYFKENLIDLAENVLIDKLKDNDIQAAMFVLKTLGKKRGWGGVNDTNNLTLNIDNKKIDIKVIAPNNYIEEDNTEEQNVIEID
jgi:hypothetical protein